MENENEKICDYCRSWCAKTMKQRNNRLANMRELPNTTIIACPKCGGTDWAITASYIDGVQGPSPNLLLTSILASVAVVGAFIYLVLQVIKWPMY